jgi:murein DD-endopeptidase MepM/ murein hydrolase activator NlpD
LDASQPGTGSATPLPPSSKKPLPAEKTPTVAEQKATVAAPAADLSKDVTAASAATFAMPVAGKIIRPYAKGKNDGIDISATAGSPVKAAGAGTVAAVTKDTKGTPIIVLRHAGGLLTVYAGVDGLTVAKGDKVKRGQTIATVRAGDPAFLHFEVRKGVESVDPMGYLQ